MQAGGGRKTAGLRFPPHMDKKTKKEQIILKYFFTTGNDCDIVIWHAAKGAARIPWLRRRRHLPRRGLRRIYCER